LPTVAAPLQYLATKLFDRSVSKQNPMIESQSIQIVAPKLRSLATDRSPVICIDDFLVDPEPLIELATRAPFIDVGSLYPGVRAPAPEAYVQAMLEAVAPVVEQTYGGPPFASSTCAHFR